MANSGSDLERRDGALGTFPSAWRRIYVAVFIVLCIAFAALAAIEYDDRVRWTLAPFTTLTEVVIGTGTASGLLSLFITEIGRAIVLPSVWLEKKLNENLEKGRERARQQRERARKQAEEKGLEKGLKEGREEGRKEGREKGRKEGREQGYEAGRRAGLLEAQGKTPPPPPWEDNGSE